MARKERLGVRCPWVWDDDDNEITAIITPCLLTQQPNLWPNEFLAEWRGGGFMITRTIKTTMTTTTARTMTITQQPISWSDAFLAEGGEGKK